MECARVGRGVAERGDLESPTTSISHNSVSTCVFLYVRTALFTPQQRAIHCKEGDRCAGEQRRVWPLMLLLPGVTG